MTDEARNVLHVITSGAVKAILESVVFSCIIVSTMCLPEFVLVVDRHVGKDDASFEMYAMYSSSKDGSGLSVSCIRIAAIRIPA